MISANDFRRKDDSSDATTFFNEYVIAISAV